MPPKNERSHQTAEDRQEGRRTSTRFGPESVTARATLGDRETHTVAQRSQARTTNSPELLSELRADTVGQFEGIRQSPRTRRCTGLTLRMAARTRMRDRSGR